MATLTMEMGDHRHEKLKMKILMDQFMKQQQVLQQLRQSLQQVFLWDFQFHRLMVLQVKVHGQ